MTEPQREPALHSIRIFDLSHVLAGLWCTMTLVDLSANVIKVENPKGAAATCEAGGGPAVDTSSGQQPAHALTG
jgi:crotonobetainyl-CoA:carnitine CoA-transferase CaiB-like acyl-CoA transferase